MTKTFDTLIEQMLTELMPASMEWEGGAPEAAERVNKKIEELPGPSQHWGPLQKLSPETRMEITKAIIAHIFSDNDANTYSLSVNDPDELKDAIQSAIKSVAEKNPEFKASGKWAVKFLSDRLSNKELLGNVKYTTAGGDETVKKDVTQKEIKQALKKALEEKPAKSDEPTAEETEAASPDVELFYQKAADLESDDDDLNKAFSKLPADKDMTWQEVLKLIGMSKATALLDQGGITEISKEKEQAEDAETPELEVDDEDDAYDPMKDVGSSFGEYEREMRSKYDY